MSKGSSHKKSLAGLEGRACLARMADDLARGSVFVTVEMERSPWNPWILHGFYLMNMQNMGFSRSFLGKKRSRRQWLMANGLHDQHQKEHKWKPPRLKGWTELFRFHIISHHFTSFPKWSNHCWGSGLRSRRSRGTHGLRAKPRGIKDIGD